MMAKYERKRQKQLRKEAKKQHKKQAKSAWRRLSGKPDSDSGDR